MAGEDRDTARAVELGRALRERPYDYDFFFALRSLECANPGAPRLGQSVRPADDPVRLAQEPSLAFAPSALASFHPGTGGRPPRLASYFLGLFGPNGPLPLHLTEYARERLRNSGDATFSRFADLFHHRMLALFYRAWASAQPTVNFDRPEADRFALYVGALFGLGMSSLRGRDAMPDLAKLNYAGRLVCQTRNAEGLGAIVEDFFGLPAAIETFTGEWLDLPERSLCLLGTSLETGSLGRALTVGARTWECQHKFRIVLGPMSFAAYESFLPRTENLGRLAAIVRNYSGDELAWDVTLALRGEEVPALRLGGDERLGLTTWLAGRGRGEDASDLTLNPLSGVA